MPRRKCSQEREQVASASKSIIVPVDLEEYKAIVTDPTRFRACLDEMIAIYPELFPTQIAEGYTLHDMRGSIKLPDIELRRIKLRADERQVFTITPSGVMPYMTGLTDEVEKALFLRRFGVPFWALSYVFGRSDQYWYRLHAHFGRYDIVQATVRTSQALPEHLLADEKHVRFNGEKGYIATTVGADCVLGASLALGADTDSLKEAYQDFQQETKQLDPDYAPQTVNTDGWAPTQNAWRKLFPCITIIECFLHAFLKIRARCKKRMATSLAEIGKRVWDAYHAIDPAAFHEQLCDLHQWARENVSGTALEAVHKLCAKADVFALAFDYPEAYRTSNMIDRHMQPMARWLASTRFFHGHWHSAERQVRAWALFHNFWPYCPRSKIRQRYRSPAHKLNGFVYHPNWLHNLRISTSLAGARC